MKNVLKSTRRGLLKGMLATPFAGAALSGIANASTDGIFTHGVASGDPLKDRVILWTRAEKAGTIRWEMSEDAEFSTVIRSGSAHASADKDYCVKVDADGLKPGHSYYYRFSAGKATSPVGRTKTLPAGEVETFRMGVVSCSNYPQGYFNTYRALAGRPIDVVLHLGDYIYEYAAGIYANADAIKKGRQVKPEHEIITADDYRTRYALYRSDKDLQAAHAHHPFICIWDDHEIANDSYKDGAQNHDPESEGSYAERRANAVSVYYEWMPIREADPKGEGRIQRRFDIGSLASIMMLETRLLGRDKQLDYAEDVPPLKTAFDMTNPAAPRALLTAEAIAAAPKAAIQYIAVPFDFSSGSPTPMTDLAKAKALDPKNLPEGLVFLPDFEGFRRERINASERQMMGAEQESWLDSNLKDSVAQGIRWQILGQQLLMGKLVIPAIPREAVDFERASFLTEKTFGFFQQLAARKMPFNLDSWDGYPAARQRVFDMIRASNANVMVLAGDTHNAWGFNLSDDQGPVAVEAATPGVSSPGLETYLPVDTDLLEKAFVDANEELVYLDAQHRGWMEVDLTAQRVETNWFFLDTVLDKDYKVISGKTLAVTHGSRQYS